MSPLSLPSVIRFVHGCFPRPFHNMYKGGMECIAAAPCLQPFSCPAPARGFGTHCLAPFWAARIGEGEERRMTC